MIATATKVLQAIVWASSFKLGRYGEVGLKAALLGKETLGPGRPLGAGLLNCPQLGALRYLRGAERRLDAAVDRLIGQSLVRRETVERDGLTTYSTLIATEAGHRVLGSPCA